jgi:hypothetical protein
MKLLFSENASALSLTHFIPAGQYGLFQIEYELDAAAGVTLTRANLGNIELNWNGQSIINVDAEMLNLRNNLYGGVAEFASAVGAACRMSVFIYCGLPYDALNVYDISSRDRVYFKLDFPALTAANIDSGTIRIFAKHKTGIMRYLEKILPRPVVAGGAGVLADQYNVSNVAAAYFKAAATLLTDIQLSKDGQQIVNSPVDTLIAYSDHIHQLETTNAFLALEFVETKDVRESLGNVIDWQITFSGAGTQQLYFSAVEFTPVKQSESTIVAQKKLQALPNPIKILPNATSKVNVAN